MTVTEQVVDFVRTAHPPADRIDRAAADLARFRSAAQDGADSAVVRALTGVATDPESPQWIAWLTGTAAAGAGDTIAWIAVCAAATALAPDAERAVHATAIGYEVAARTAEALGPSHTEAGWSVSATAGVIGAGAAAGSLLGLAADELRNTIALCATQAAGLAAVEGTDAGAVQIGKAACNAVEAALLGQQGFTSSEEPLAGRRGMFALMSTQAQSREWRLEFQEPPPR